MPRRKTPPSYRFHKARDCAVVTIHGKDHYLGRYGSPESHQEFARLIAENYGGGCELPTPSPLDRADLSIDELVARYWTEYVEIYHVKSGEPTARQHHVRAAMRPLCELYGDTPVREFGPKKLKVVRDTMIAQRKGRRGRISRTYVNDHVGIIKRMFRWAVAEELVSVSVYEALRTVESIHKNRDARVEESRKVLPAPEASINAVLRLLPPQLQTMVRLQILTGMRPDEVTIMRPCDIQRTGAVWRYVPEHHKNQHRDIGRVVLLGPQAQSLITPWLDRDSSEYLFAPKDAVEWSFSRRRKRQANAKGKRSRRKRRLCQHYNDASYQRAVVRACEKANVPRWTPGQLRHNAATRIRREYDLEAARVLLGHQSAVTTEIYAEKDLEKAVDIVRKTG